MPSSQGPSPGSWGPQSGPSPHLAVYKQVPPYPQPDGTPESNRRAQEESYAINERRLIYEAKQGEHSRNEDLRDQIHLAVVVGIWCAVFALLAAFFVWVFHLLAPEEWQFLTAQRISKPESSMTTGSIATLIANYFRQRL